MQIDVLGMQEYGDTAIGYQALDAIVKAAPVRIIRVLTVNPGKLVIFFTGDVASVEASLAAGERTGAEQLVDRLLIPNLHPAVAAALAGAADTVEWDAVGVVDVATITGGVEAADKGAKATGVRVVQIRFDDSMGGRSSVRFTGSLHEVEEAMAAMEEFLTPRNLLVRRVIIANPHPDVLPSLHVETETHNER